MAITEDVKLLRFSHIPRGIITQRLAFATDPLQFYLRYSIPTKLWQRTGFWIIDLIIAGVVLIQYIGRLHIALQIDDATAILAGKRAYDSPPPKQKWPTFGDIVIKVLVKARLCFMPKEQVARFVEVDIKIKQTIERVLGKDAYKYISIDLLATRPQAQGKGYGSTLVRAVHSMADAQHRKVWLMSSNIENTGFYQSLGYTSVADVLIGDSNPSWHNGPMVVKMMIRDPDESKLR